MEWMQSNILLSINVPCIIELYRQEVNAEGLNGVGGSPPPYEIYLKTLTSDNLTLAATNYRKIQLCE